MPAMQLIISKSCDQPDASARQALGGSVPRWQLCPRSPESAVTGAVLGVFLSDKKSGRIISAQDFANMSVEDAVKKFEAM